MLSSINMISTFDLKLIQEIFNNIKTQYPENLVRFQYFLATCFFLDVNNNFGSFLKTDHIEV